MAWAKKGGALFFELRAANAFAQRLIADDRHGEARRTLEGVVARFAQGEEHAELSAARAMLARTGAVRTG